MKKIVIFGICGKMGISITKELLIEKDIDVLGGFDRINIGDDISKFIVTETKGKKVYGTYEEIKQLNPDLIIDFTNSEAAFRSVNWAIDNKVDMIIGTTGLNRDEINSIETRALKGKSKVFLVPNFSIGAVIMMKVSELISKYFENCEIIELHHDKKKDAPSGTSILTAEKVGSVKKFNSSRLKESEVETVKGSRGAFSEGVHIHSVRLPGLLAHQEVIFGAAGQTLSLRHDSIDRISFYPGVLLAVRSIDRLPNFTYGLDKIIDL